jgi:Ca2+-transporting ATPase
LEAAWKKHCRGSFDFMVNLIDSKQSPAKIWHALDTADVLGEFGSRADRGFDTTEITERLARFGPNALSARKGRGPLVRLLLQFHQPLVYILIVAGLITAGLQEWVDSGVIFAVVILNSIVGFVQESRALRALEALARTMTAECTVVRNGEARRVSSTAIVPGDIVLLQSGDKVPADLRLIHSRDLQIDESALTGESVPIQKISNVLQADTSLADRRNMAYATGLVTYGQGKGVVVATGDGTEVGRISELIAEAEELKTPLTGKIAAFSHVLLYVILGLSAVTFAVGMLRGETAVDMFMASVALAVGAIPEGLPAAMTVILAIGVARMAKRRAIIRKLPAVETLGSTTVICTDKTGTLTKNQMTVRELFDGQDLYETTGIGYDPFEGRLCLDGGPVDADRSATLTECLRCGLLCNDSMLVQKEDRWVIEGDPTEGALIVVAHKLALTHEAENERFERIESIAFESQHQYMATLHNSVEGSPSVVYVKGAVEVLLDRCTSALTPAGDEQPIDRSALLRTVDAMAGKGLRVLAFARKTLPADVRELNHSDVADGLAFLGLQAMIDPPRTEAIEAVRECRAAGITVKMITGDHAGTAEAIAREIGIIGATPTDSSTHYAAEDDAPCDVLTGGDLAQMSDADLVGAAQRCHVFARVTPEQKLRLVKAIQSTGHVVAMTGDGVNDAPALKQANIGVAMGMSGTEVAKEAADMVLTDDNFATIKSAVEEGRGVFDNLMKFIVWTLPTNAGEGLVILAAVATGAALPLLPVHILWINMSTAVLLGVMLAFETRETDVMLRPPRDPARPLFNRDLAMRVGLVGMLLLAGAFGLFKWERINGAEVDAARTVAVNAFVIIELCYLFNCRSLAHSMFYVGAFSNRWLLIGVTAMLLLQLVFTYAPFMNQHLHTAPITLAAWGRIFTAGLAVYLIVGFEKWVRRRVGNL